MEQADAPQKHTSKGGKGERKMEGERGVEGMEGGKVGRRTTRRCRMKRTRKSLLLSDKSASDVEVRKVNSSGSHA
jgi:hypothetical protein